MLSLGPRPERLGQINAGGVVVGSGAGGEVAFFGLKLLRSPALLAQRSSARVICNGSSNLNSSERHQRDACQQTLYGRQRRADPIRSARRNRPPSLGEAHCADDENSLKSPSQMTTANDCSPPHLRGPRPQSASSASRRLLPSPSRRYC
jgi:hypothetical protein